MLIYSDERIIFSTRHFRLSLRDQCNVNIIIIVCNSKIINPTITVNCIHCTAARYDYIIKKKITH